MYAYHQNALLIPEYLEKLREIAGEGPVFVIYRNPIDAALSIARQLMQGHAGDIDVGLKKKIFMPGNPLNNMFDSFMSGAFRELIDERFNYVNSAKTVRSVFPLSQIKEYLFEDRARVLEDLAGALGCTLSPLERPVNVSYTPRNWLLYKIINFSYSRITRRDSGQLRTAVTDGGATGLLAFIYRLNQRPPSTLLSPEERQQILSNLPFSLSEFSDLTGLRPDWT